MHIVIPNSTLNLNGNKLKQSKNIKMLNNFFFFQKYVGILHLT